MILKVTGKIAVESTGTSWTIREGDRLRFPGGLLATTRSLIGAGSIRPEQGQRLATVVALAKQLSRAVQGQLTMPGSAVSFAGGGFTIIRGYGDYSLTNPTLEVARLPGEKDASKRRSIVGFCASPADALMLALERTLQACTATLPYSALDANAFELASRLWADLGVVASSTDDKHLDADSRAVRMGISSADTSGGLLCQLRFQNRIPCLTKRVFV